MALNFPSTTGQATDGSFTHTESGVTWAWDGITWKSQTSQTQQNESDPVFLASPAGLITSQDVTEWDTSYGWGDHASAGYLTSLGDAAAVTTAKISNWDNAYSWGDHAAAGYLTSYTSSDTLATVTGRGASTSTEIEANGGVYIPAGADLELGTDFSIARFSNQNKARIQYTGPGYFYFEIDDVLFKNSANNRTHMSFEDGSGVGIFYNNNQKFATTSTGVVISGDIDLGSGDLTTTGKIYYSNNFENSVDLPSATTYHGMFAHVHAEGHGYFAHAGAWTQLLDTGSNISELADVSNNSPSTNDVLTWNGSSWTPSAAQGGSGGGGGTSLGSRQIFSGSTSNSHANNASENLTIAAYKGYALYKISVSEPSWVTLYVSSATRTSDASREITQDPDPGSGIIAEAITQSSSETVLFTPALIGYNDDSTPGTNIYLKVVNKSGSTQSINVDLTVTQLEA